MSTDNLKLLQPYKMGDLELTNRMVMAPMTRSRASEEDRLQSPHAPVYYAQRSSAGLIVTEATQISQQGIGYIQTPGIHTEAQVEAWKPVVEAVHAKGGKIFAQLWHVGRVSHPDFHGGDKPVAPSAVKPDGTAYTTEGEKELVEPRALRTEEIPGIVQDFKHAAQCAKDAGFDGVEIHGANGYLIDQFLRDGSNQRDDQYGGSYENRTRFLLEVIAAVQEVWANERIGVRLSPEGEMNDMKDSNPEELFGYVAEQVDKTGIQYIHLAMVGAGSKYLSLFRDKYSRTLIANGSYDRDSGEQDLQNDLADLICYGVPYLANPDLPERYRVGADLNDPQQDKFYGGGTEGYIDYPTLAEQQVA